MEEKHTITGRFVSDDLPKPEPRRKLSPLLAAAALVGLNFDYGSIERRVVKGDTLGKTRMPTHTFIDERHRPAAIDCLGRPVEVGDKLYADRGTAKHCRTISAIEGPLDARVVVLDLGYSLMMPEQMTGGKIKWRDVQYVRIAAKSLPRCSWAKEPKKHTKKGEKGRGNQHTPDNWRWNRRRRPLRIKRAL